MTDKNHEADHERVAQQNSFTNFAHDVEDNNKGGGWVNGIFRAAVGATPVGQALAARKSDFEDHDLNTMLDMVHQTNPEDLETSGSALWDARDAIKAAASELDGHITKVHWVGESGDSFRDFGGKLVVYAEQLSTYAGTAGDQLSAASAGLASVRSAMPPRDTRPNAGQRPEQLPAVKQVEGNDDYAAAVKVEKDRQEAINQMNRLSSYYVVSAEQLETLQQNPPKLEAMPDVGVPKPAGHTRSPGETGTGTSTGTATSGSHHVSQVAVGHPQVSDSATATTTPPAKHAEGTITFPDRAVGTEIDSVGTLPSPTAPSPTTGPAPVSGGPNLTGPSANGFGNGYVPPMTGGTTGRNVGPAGTRSPLSAQGRSGGPSGTGNQSAARSMGRGGAGEMGRAASTARGGTAGGKAASPMGRGISGGTPRAAGSTPRTAGGPTTGAGRSNGVVGGRPTNARTGAPGQNGSRIPRGSVMGAEATGGNSRSTTGRVGQRGVFGAPGSNGSGAKQTGANPAGTNRGGTAREAVTGNPASRGSAARAERNGMTRGGSGLVRGPGKNGKPNEEETEAAERPDYVVEDVNTHLPANRRDVPPVVN
ncbi:hypothetical protein V2W30_29295 [Streptomyces sp. Q6]|uniref:Uncharacterized protein n=1 Tax=Streptomyces citrinus TaxID=3118173 RepID=A0ACD5AJG8_9ACTN